MWLNYEKIAELVEKINCHYIKYWLYYRIDINLINKLKILLKLNMFRKIISS